MDLSALNRASKVLESRLDSFGFWLTVFTLLVVIGLVLEYWHQIPEFIDNLMRPAALFPWKQFMEIAGGILVTIGVAGELVIQFRASRAETDLRSTSHQIEATLNESAKKAEASAAEAKLELEEFKAPRRLTDKQAGDISEELKRFSGQQFDVLESQLSGYKSNRISWLENPSNSDWDS